MTARAAAFTLLRVMAGLDQALHLARSEKHTEALRVFESLVADPRTRREALGHRAWLLRSLGRDEEARHDYEAVTRQAPDDLDAAALLADTDRRLGHLPEAAERALAVLGRDVRHRLALEVLDQCQVALGVEPIPERVPPDPGQAISTGPVNPVIERLEQDPQGGTAAVHPQIGRLLHCLALCCRPQMVLETGCHVGHSTLCLAQGLEDNGAGHLHSFDLFPEQPDYESPVIGPCPDTRRAAQLHLERAGLAHRVTLHRGDSSTTIRQMFEGQGEVFDLAFIDGDHNLRGCLRDWSAVDPLMAEGGIVLLHDTEPGGCGWLGPRYLLEKLGETAAENYHWINLPTFERIGLALIQKRTPGRSPRWRPTLIESVVELLHRQRHWAKRFRRC